MRNLKKILALVLALVMSLSLMATAGAADFKDASSINDKYETAVEVLESLGVFRGYEDGSFQPTGSITRAETAAIIYRIVTGDVKDEQVGIYADYNLFTDVPSTAWFAGYVNYCANAEYIKGVGGGKFNPNAQVTGYAALAMILRAIGYTANGGFTGPDWEVQTARVGEQRKITKNIMTGTLGQPATRESVAEILFQAILVNMVNHNVLNAQNGQQGYFETDMTLGYKTFKLEQIEGVVMANEYANLNGTSVIGKDKTDLQVAGEDSTRRLAKGTEITDIGESRYAYVSGTTVHAFGDTGKNKVTDTEGKAVDIGSASKFSAVAGMPAASDIKYYTNFDLNVTGNKSCDQRLEFSVTFYGPDAEKAFDGYKGIDISKIAAADKEWSVENVTTDKKVELNAGAADYTAATTTPAYTYPVKYTKIVWAGVDITTTDLDVLESIFGTADNADNNKPEEKRIAGYVSVNTKSTDIAGEDNDLSDTISYKKFVAEYLNDNASDVIWSRAWNGYWVKFIDNDGDGACEYAFRTNYTLDEALYTYTDRDGNVYYEFNNFDDEVDDVVYLDGYTPSVGDKVLAAYIDGQYLVEPANSENVVVSAYNWRTDEVTTDKGTYGQSGVGNATAMQELISNMDEKTEYVVYFDHFGFVRAYELPGGTKYALVTELYYNNDNQGSKVTNWPMTAELTMPDADGKAVTAEYASIGGASTFTAKAPWSLIQNLKGTQNYYNWLQPAIGALGVTNNTYKPVKGEPTWATPETQITFWPADYQLVRAIAANGMDAVSEFNYGAQNFGNRTYKGYAYPWNVGATASFTNIAVVNDTGDNITLSGAASLNLNKDGTVNAAQPYAVNYIQLSTGDVAKGAVRYAIGGTNAYQTANNTWVNAVHDTEYYIVYNGGVYYTTDYVNFPGLDAEDNMIHAAYAVARNTNADNDGAPYWVADVIVYEIYDVLDNLTLSSVSLAFFRESRETDKVQKASTLNSKYGETILTPENYDWWATDWAGLGFYGLYDDTEPDEDGYMTAKDVDKLGIGDYAKNNIHAGTIIREARVEDGGEYIDVALGNGKTVSIEVTDKIYSITKSTSSSDRDWEVYDANLLRTRSTTNREVRVDDMVIWVGGAKTDGTKSSTNFVVDLGSLQDWGNAYAGKALLTATAPFLVDTYKDADGKLQITGYGAANNNSGLWQQIMYEQTAPADPFKITVTKVYDAADADETNLMPTVTATVTPDTFSATQDGKAFNVTITVPNPYAITAVAVANVGEKLAGKNADIVATNVADRYRITGATGDVELKIAVAKVQHTVAVDSTAVGTLTGLQIEVNGNAAENWNGAAKTLNKGDSYKISFNALNTITYTVDGEKTAATSGKIVITGAVGDANKTYVIGKLENKLTVNVAAASGLVLTNLKVNSVAATVGTAVNLKQDAAYTVEFDAAANTTYSIAKDGGDAVKQTSANGKISYTDTLDKDTVLTVNKMENTLSATKPADLTLELVAGAVTNNTWDGTAVTVNTGATYTIKFSPAPNKIYKWAEGAGTAKEVPAVGADSKVTLTGTVDANTVVTITAEDAPTYGMPEPDANGVITLIDKVILDEPYTINSDTTIRLNGNNITFTGDVHEGFELTGTADLTIEGSGTISAETVDYEGVIRVSGNGNTLTIGKDVVIQGNKGVDTDGDGKGYAIVIGAGASNAVIDMNGTLTGGCGLTVHGDNRSSVGTININGRIDVDDCGMYLAGVATTNVNADAEIVAGHTAIEIRNGTLNVNGGNVEGNVSAPTFFRPTPAGGGSTGFNAGIVVSSYGFGPIMVRIYGGAVNGRSQLALQGKLSSDANSAIKVEYLDSVITTMPMFGSNNEQSEYWTATSNEALHTTTLEWAYTA